MCGGPTSRWVTTHAVKNCPEAREPARRSVFRRHSSVAGSICDHLCLFLQSGPRRRLMDDVTRAVDAASGWHGWLWRLRLSQARAGSRRAP